LLIALFAQAAAVLFLAARFWAAARGIVVGDHLDSLAGRVFWSAMVLGSWGCFGSLLGDGVNLATGILLLALLCCLSVAAVWTARGRGKLRLCLAAVLATGLMGVGGEAVLVGLKLDGHAPLTPWVFVLFPLLLAIPTALSVAIGSCIFLGGGRRGSRCGQLWDCSRPEPAEGIALGLMTALVEMGLIVILMTANLLLPLLESDDAGSMTRPYSLCLLPIEILLAILAMIQTTRAVKSCLLG
jgi:hypothetical protein